MNYLIKAQDLYLQLMLSLFRTIKHVNILFVIAAIPLVDVNFQLMMLNFAVDPDCDVEDPMSMLQRYLDIGFAKSDDMRSIYARIQRSASPGQADIMNSYIQAAARRFDELILVSNTF